MNNSNTVTSVWKKLIIPFFLLVVVVLGIVYVRKPQDIRNKAAVSGSSISMNPSTITARPGSNFSVGVVLNAGPDSVSGVELHIGFDPSLVRIKGFTAGTPLPVVLSPLSIQSGTATVTLGAQPNAPLKGTDIIGRFTVETLSNGPSSTIRVLNSTMVAALEKPTNTLVSSSGITIYSTNGTASGTPTPTPHNWCAGPNGSACAWDCNRCTASGICTKMGCPDVTGTCQNNTCVKPPATPTPTPYTQAGCVRGGCNGELCVSETARNMNTTCDVKPQYACFRSARCEKQSNGQCGWTQTSELRQCLEQYITPTPTPPVGCFYQQVQCIQAPCNPILVCPTKTPTPTVSPTPITSGSQVIDLRVKLAGVTDGSANGAKVGIKFVKLGGETLQLSGALPLVHVGNGIYKAEATLTNSLPFGTKFRIKVKGEKHLTSEFCFQVGQTGPCKDNEYITMPNFIAQTYGFDLTGIPLQPGDVPPQDGKVDATDFNAIKSLMSKLCSELTAQDKLKADLDYNGCITVKDIFLIRQTLETRYDE